MMKELGVALRNMRDLIASCEPCPEKVAMQVRFDLMVERLKGLPAPRRCAGAICRRQRGREGVARRNGVCTCGHGRAVAALREVPT
jgi:hypothetical protein